jgi:hypothetical protein
MKVCFTLPDVAKRLTPPDRALLVVNGAVAEVAPIGIESDAGIVKAAFVDFRVITVGEASGAASETTQLPEIPGVRAAGAQDSDQG